MNAFELLCAGVASDKIVVSEHGSAYGVNKIYKNIKQLVYPKVYCVAVPNKMDVDVYKNLGANAIYVPHMVYMRQHERNRLDSHIILNVGRLTPDKRQDLLIQAWYKNKHKNDWKLWIVGDGEKKNELQLQIESLGLSNSVELLPATKNIDSIYRQASFFAFSSRFEGFGLVLLEAMSYGIPCLAFDCPSGPRDIIDDGINGFLVDNGNID